MTAPARVVTGPSGPAVVVPPLPKPGGALTTSGAAAAVPAPMTRQSAEGLVPLAQPRVEAPIPQRGPTLVKYEVETREVTALMDDGIAYTYWTFGNTVPGPMLRVREGDAAELTLENAPDSKPTHSIDLHPGLAPNKSRPLDVGYDYDADRMIAPAGLSPARPTAYLGRTTTTPFIPPSIS